MIGFHSIFQLSILLMFLVLFYLCRPPETVKSDGIRGIYRGYGPSVAGIIVYRAGNIVKPLDLRKNFSNF